MSIININGERQKGVTLAICTHNGKTKLKQTIEYVLAQNFASNIAWELLVVDNVSTDGTSEFVRYLWPSSRCNQLRVIREENLGAIHARSRAIKEAKYTYLSYVDDDNWISANWIAEIYGVFEKNPTVGIVSCPSTGYLSEPPPQHFELVKGWLAIGYQCDEDGIVKRRPISFWTAGCSFRLEAFDLLDGSGIQLCLTGRKGTQPLGGEDHELCLILTLCGWDVYFCHSISFQHAIPKVRLQKDQIKRLIYHSVKCYTVLDIYRDYYRNKKFLPGILRFFLYFRRFVIRTIALNVKALLREQALITPNEISFWVSKGALVGFFEHILDMQQAIKNIKIAEQINNNRKTLQLSNVGVKLKSANE